MQFSPDVQIASATQYHWEMGGSAIPKIKRTSTDWFVAQKLQQKKTRKTDQDEFRYCSVPIAQDRSTERQYIQDLDQVSKV
jgi:hypothetical protein